MRFPPPFPGSDDQHVPVPCNAEGDGPVPLRFAVRLLCSCGREAVECGSLTIGYDYAMSLLRRSD